MAEVLDELVDFVVHICFRFDMANKTKSPASSWQGMDNEQKGQGIHEIQKESLSLY